MQNFPTPDQWRDWLREHGPRFLLYARQQTRYECDAEDVLQESLHEAWQRANGTPPDALVFSTIRRRAIDAARSATARSARDFAHSTQLPLWVEPEVESRDLHRHLSEAIEHLPPHLREVLTLKMWGKLTFAKIAQVTGYSLPTVAGRYSQALDALRKQLKGVGR